MTTTCPPGSWPAAFPLVKACSSRNACRFLSAVAFLLFSSVCLQAQTAHFGYALSTLGSGFSHPTYAALDSSGNLYVTDQGTSSVYELTASSGYTTVKTLSTRFGIPTGIAVDANANVFVTDQSVAGVYELTAASNYATVITLGSGFSNPNGVAERKCLRRRHLEQPDQRNSGSEREHSRYQSDDQHPWRQLQPADQRSCR